MKPANNIKPSALILGRCHQAASPSSPKHGSRALNVPTGGEPFVIDRECHLMTIASTNSDKASAIIIPNLLHYAGPVVVTDPKGDYYRATSDARRAMGHSVFRIDPFGVIDQQTDSIDAKSFLSPSSPNVEIECQQWVAALFSEKLPVSSHWDVLAIELITAVLGYIICVPEKQVISGLITTFGANDVVYNLAVVLDTIGKKIPPFAYRDISAFLQRADAERSRTLSTCKSLLNEIKAELAWKTFDHASFPLDDITAGKPLSIYLMIPPIRLPECSSWLRLWVGTLLHCIARRREHPAQRTLFILDEAAQFGTFRLLESVLTLCKGDGLQVWTFWQNLGQLRQRYPTTWQTIVGECGVVQVLENRDYSVVSEVSALLGIDADEIRKLESNEQFVCSAGVCHRIKKVDCQTDKLFTSGRIKEGSKPSAS